MKKKKWGDKVGGPRRATIKNGGSKRARHKDSFGIQVESELNLASTQFWLKCCFVKRCLPWSLLSPFSALLSDCYSFSDFIIPPPPLDYKSVPSGQEPHLICSSPEPSTEPDSTAENIYLLIRQWFPWQYLSLGSRNPTGYLSAALSSTPGLGYGPRL